jgi:thermostable 8-oxoguanine DNA glycosylase
MPENIRLEELIDRKAGLYTQAIQGLKSWPMVYRKVLECYNNRANLRQFILKEIKGLGLAKVSFFLALCFPYDNYLCLDTWMLKFLEIDTKDINTLAKYEYVENYIGKLARVFKYTPFMFQWALWEYHQKKGPVDHSCLYN